MFKGISHHIARQFTAFVFLLFMINGALFLIADVGNARRMTQDRLRHTAETVMQPAQFFLESGGELKMLPLPVRERLRIIGANGDIMYGGSVFQDVEVPVKPGFGVLSRDEDDYTLFTIPIVRNGVNKGTIQVVNQERLPIHDLPLRAGIYLLLSVIVSALTYFVGLLFARNSLKPAEEAMHKLEQFTQDASHELRTPLAALNSSLDLALKTGAYKEGILSAKDDVKEITVLIERLLELTRLEATLPEMEYVDLSSLVTESVERYKPEAATKKITLKTDIASAITVKGDPSLIRRIIGNLLSNAIKFTDENGVVTVKLTKSFLSVEDTGVGIRAADLDRIFDRFYQADPSRSNDGYGLGLALAKRVCQLHGWSIVAKSKHGKGTTMTVRFAHTETTKES